MDIEFWGVRGSVPSPGPDTSQFGGNTACVEIRCKDEPVIVLDAGTGIRKLGYKIANEKPATDIALLLSHTHWDHIQGLPFFAPLFSPHFSISIYGPVHYTKNLKDILSLQMEYTYFPVRVEELAANIKFHDTGECEMRIGNNVKVTTKFVNHPVVCLSYRVEHNGKSFTYLTDHEPYHRVYNRIDRLVAKNEDLYEVAKAEHQGLVDFIHGTDMLCIDGQYTPTEYETKVGWGHSALDDAYELAFEGKVKEMVVFHHEPDRSDAELQRMLYSLQDRAWKSNLEAIPLRLARERQIIKI
ncbi:MAG: MBL fold metallo-hydrolase [Nitrospinota bacterium]